MVEFFFYKCPPLGMVVGSHFLMSIYINFAFCGDIGIEDIFYLKNYPKVVQNGDMFLLILCR